MRNNFQELEEQELRQSRGPSTGAYKGVMGGMRSMKFVGGMFDHFIPKLFQFFVTVLGGSKKSQTTRISHHLSDDEPLQSLDSRRDYPNRQ